VTTIHLVRHGETLANRIGRFAGRTDEPLTALGRKQAREAAASLREAGISLIYTSPVARARETAAIMASILKIPVEEEPGLAEISIPPWDGRLKSDLERDPDSKYASWKKDPSVFSLPGAETLADLQKRAMASVRVILERHAAEAVAAVSHLALIRVILLAVEGKDLSFYRHIHVPNAAPLALTWKDENYYVQSGVIP